MNGGANIPATTPLRRTSEHTTGYADISGSIPRISVDDVTGLATVQTTSSNHSFDTGNDGFCVERVYEHNSAHESLPLSDRILEEAKLESFEALKEAMIHKDNVDLNKCDSEGLTALHHACLRGALLPVQIMLVYGHFIVDVNIRDKIGRTPLHYIARSKIKHGQTKLLLEEEEGGPDETSSQEEQITKLLLQKKSDINCKDADGMIPLHYAIISGKVSIVKTLMLSPELDVASTTNMGLTPLHLAAGEGSLEICQMLLDELQKKQSENSRDSTKSLTDLLASDDIGQTPLHKASAAGHLVVVKRLVAEAFERKGRFGVWQILTKASDNEKKNALFLAVENNHQKVTEYLLNHTDRHQLEKNKASLLHYAAWMGDLRLLKLIYDPYGERDKKDINSRTPLHYAVMQNKTVSIKFLLEKQERVDLKDKDGLTPLIRAIMSGHAEAVKLLLEAEADVNLMDKHGRNILHYCTRQEHLSVLQLLLTDYKDQISHLVNKSDNFGNTPLHEAASRGSIKVMKCLLEDGDASVGVENKEYNTPLGLAAYHGHPEVITNLLRRRSGLDLLSHKNLTEDTPLHIACSHGNTEVTQILLSRGAAREDVNTYKRTALMCAASSGHLQCCLLLLEHGCDVNSLGLESNTALHFAAENGHSDVVEALMENGANICLKNNAGKNPLESAIEGGEEVVALGIVQSDRWSLALNNTRTDDDGHVTSPFRMLIQRFPKVAEAVLNKCLSIQPHEQICYMNFEFVEDDWQSSSVEKNRENHPLNLMVKYGRLNLLGHRVSQTLIDHKWSIYGRTVYFCNLFVFLSFLLSLTLYVLYIVDESFARNKIDSFHENINCTVLKIVCERNSFVVDVTAVFPFQVAVMVTSAMNLIKEMLQLYQSRWSYFTFQNMMEVICFCFAILLVVDQGDNKTDCSVRMAWQWNLGSLSIFFSWFDLILRVRKFPFLGIYVVMLAAILKSFCKFFIVFLLFLLTFTMSFYMVFRTQEPFDHFVSTILKTSFMTIGDLSYEEIFMKGQEVPFIGYMLIVLFLLLMPILTMNLLIGLAVDDIKTVVADASLKRLAMKVMLILDIETLIPSWLRKREYMKNSIILTSLTLPLNEEHACQSFVQMARHFASKFWSISKIKSKLNHE